MVQLYGVLTTKATKTQLSTIEQLYKQGLRLMANINILARNWPCGHFSLDTVSEKARRDPRFFPMLLSGVVGLFAEKIAGISPVVSAAITDKLFCVFFIYTVETYS